MEISNKEAILSHLKDSLDSYYPMTNEAWDKLKNICHIKKIKKKEYLFKIGDKALFISYIYTGLLRIFVTNDDLEFNKNFFWEGRFAAPTKALISNEKIESYCHAIEDTVVVNIDYNEYKNILSDSKALMLFHINYLEKHWITDKDDNTKGFAIDSALERYKKFKLDYKKIMYRLPQYHIASYLGISATHLCRIKNM